MSESLQACRETLESLYKQRLGLSFASTLNELREGRQPIWRYVSDSDLTTSERPNNPGVAGLLLDPEIGTLAYILQYRPANGLRSQIARALALRSKLATERNYVGRPNENTDDRGAWRIVMHWLVESSQKFQWLEHIVDVRRETGFSEEIAFDPMNRPGFPGELRV